MSKWISFLNCILLILKYNYENKKIKSEIEYELYYEVSATSTYSSKTFTGLLQKKINDLIESGDLSTESEEYEVMEALGLYANPEAIMELFDSIECEDYKCLEEKSDYDSLLWCTSSQLDEENISFSFE